MAARETESEEWFVSVLTDEDVMAPLWEFTPARRALVIAERRRRFGIADEEIGDPEYS